MFKYIIRFLLVQLLALLFALPSWGADEENLGLYTQFQLIGHLSKDKKREPSYFGKLLYVEKELSKGGVSVFGQLYHDPEFNSGIVGLSKKLGNFQLALGAGSSRYDGRSYTTLNPSVWYGNEETGIEGLFYVERYLRDNDEPWWAKAHLQKRVGDLALGAYAETHVGVGPLIAYYPTSEVKVWVSAPVAKRPAEGGMKAVVGLVFEF